MPRRVIFLSVCCCLFKNNCCVKSKSWSSCQAESFIPGKFFEFLLLRKSTACARDLRANYRQHRSLDGRRSSQRFWLLSKNLEYDRRRAISAVRVKLWMTRARPPEYPGARDWGCMKWPFKNETPGLAGGIRRSRIVSSRSSRRTFESAVSKAIRARSAGSSAKAVDRTVLI